jgi:hypothetical protein
VPLKYLFMLLTQRRGLPGLVDCVLSGVWSIFFLATGGALAAYRTLACFSASYW